jgi:aryl-alcohol dehydrogenase-like predicted oxidoreductase
MEKRALGKTGERLSVVGFGGIIVMNESAEQAARWVAEAVEGGVNYFDVAPSYGNAEQMLGPALEPYRKRVFLACKTGKRSRKESREELEQSLRHLRTDHLDLYQLHGLSSLEEVDTVTSTDGALETFERARREGLVRYLGFSAHSEEAALEIMERFEFDSVLFPLNWATWHKKGFGKRLLAKAEAQGIGRLALKSLAKRRWREGEERSWPKCWYAPVDSYEEASLALRFTLGLPVTAAVSPSHMELFRWACQAAERLRPLSEADRRGLAQTAAALEVIFPE